MSYTTQIILHVSPLDADHAADLSFWIRNHAPRSDPRTSGSPGYLAPLTGEVADEAWGGPKNPSAELWAGTTDHVDFHGVLEHIRHIPWDEPDAVQVLIKDEADPYFRLYMIRHGNIAQYSPAPPLDQQELPW